jgi:uncharacterized protein with ParB-like and HNH nuclease domain
MVQNYSFNLQSQLDAQRKKVDVDHFDITIREIVRMALDDELQIAPSYQRKFRWDTFKESRLIESLFLGLPVPSIFVATNSDGTWELVDGLQRVSTLIHYVASSSEDYSVSKNYESALSKIGMKTYLKLEELETLSEFNKKTFDDLPKTLQISFSKRALRVTALSDKSDHEVRFDMFERLNTGGIALSAQEVRDCIFRGEFANFINRLATNEKFEDLLKLQEKRKNDGTTEEQVLKFFAYLINRDQFKGNVEGFLNEFMNQSMKNFDYVWGEELFNSTVNEIHKLVGGKFTRKGVNVTPLNQFEAVMVAIGEILSDGRKVKTPKFDWLNDAELIKHSTGATNTPSFLRARISRAKVIFGG